MIMLDDIIVSIILNYTKYGVTPIELNMIDAELQGETAKYLGDDRWKSITKKVIDASGYIMQINPHNDGDRFIDYVNLINTDEKNAYHVEPGSRPTQYFHVITDLNDPEVQGFMFMLMKDQYMMNKSKKNNFIGSRSTH